MELHLWRPWSDLVLLELKLWEYGLAALYGALIIVLLIRFRREFARMTWRRLLLFAGLLAAPLLANRLLVLDHASADILPPPGVPIKPPSLYVPLFGVLPVFVAGAWLGAGPALLVGLVTGVLRLDMAACGIAHPFQFALLGCLTGFLLRQDYRGRLPFAVRQPLIAALVATPVAVLLFLPPVFAHVAQSGLSGFDYAVTLAKASLAPRLLESLAAAVLLQLLYAFFPGLRPVRRARRSPPYSRNLNRRLLFLFVPLILAMTGVSVYAVTARALRLATTEAVDEMAGNANSVAEGIPFFIHTGQGLLSEFANDEKLRDGQSEALQTSLESDMQSVAFFNQLMLFGAEGQLLATYPPAPTGDPELTAQEGELVRRVLGSGGPQMSSAHRSPRDEALLSFLVPVEPTGDIANDGQTRALLGRTRLDVNPMINRMLAGLQWTSGEGEGFIVDASGRVVAHPDFSMLLTEWHLDEDRPRVASVPGGWAYETRDPLRNTRQLVCYVRAQGYPWSVVIRLPYDVVLRRAQKIATPLLLLQFLFGGGLVLAISLVTGWVTHPLKQLAEAADRIARGDLGQPVHVSSEDEVGRLGEAFEDMRARLKRRVDDLLLLVEVSQAVSARLQLNAGMPLILDGALDATGARVARFLLLTAEGEPSTVLSRGEPSEEARALDRALAAAVQRREGPVVVGHLARARTLTNPETIEGPIKAVVALPVRARGKMSAMIWVGYGEVRQLDSSEIDLLSTLASQSAVLVENARLFQAAEGERRRLAAILDSTNDAVAVVDQQDRVLLVNPAAERAFHIEDDAVSGRKIGETGLAPALVEVFKRPGSVDEPLTAEISLPDGRTLYANVSAILDAGDERIGRVAVMRDITHFKELDAMKSEFLATVSHDLRGPLTFVRGYATMLSTVGKLNKKQREYVEKILGGVGRVSELVDGLLDLRRIEAGVGLKREPCHLGAILFEAVDGMRAQAEAEDIVLHIEPSESSPIVAGDAVLLRQAVRNLVDNAIKYTSGGGVVTVGLSVREEGGEERALIRVADTGIGIAPDDQVRLFEKFYRIKRSETSDVTGSGMGLAIVKSIVERHDGSVWVESELNEGSTFYISLPFVRQESSEGGLSGRASDGDTVASGEREPVPVAASR